MKGQRGKRAIHVIRAKNGLLAKTHWQRTLQAYPISLITLVREKLQKRIPGITEKFNSNSRYFGYWIGDDKDRVYICVQKKNLCIRLCISRDYEGEICRADADFEIRYSHNFQGRAGWLTGWYVPHSTKNINVVIKYLLKAFEGNP